MLSTTRTTTATRGVGARMIHRLIVARTVTSLAAKATRPSSSTTAAAAVPPRPVLLLGHSALRTKCTPVLVPHQNSNTSATTNDDNHDVQALVATLLDFRRRHGFGRGIAAPQIGVTQRFLALYFDHEQTARVLTNPRIIWKSDDAFFTLWDDCMSLPWILVKVQRHVSISVEFINEQGQMETWHQCSNALSELLQHEMNHLDGILLVDLALRQLNHANKNITMMISRQEFERNPEYFSKQVDYVIRPVQSVTTETQNVTIVNME